MIKSALVKQISDAKPHLYQERVELMLNVMLEKIAGALSQGQRVEIRGFGAFSIKSRSARTGRNPRTGTPVHVKGKKFPHFKPGKEMRKRLNRMETQDSEDVGIPGASSLRQERR